MQQHPAMSGRPVFVTGHTGFKGSWLSLWLARLGARVTGYALAAPEVSMFRRAGVQASLHRHHEADVRDAAGLAAALAQARPEIVIHLAAQPLVRASYLDPLQTWSTNVMGTANLLEAVRACPSVRAVLVVTSDKCYENLERPQPYRETDALGGHDPYSASKAATELVAQSWRRSFFDANGPLLATARAGNVIGGGDFSVDRLIPDAVRAMAAGQALQIRNPGATRPWQHVLESLHGYLLLVERLMRGEREFAGPFNFGSPISDNMKVSDVLERLARHWPGLKWTIDAAAQAASPHEAGLLCLDSSKAGTMLGWQPTWSLDRALEKTAQWYAADQNDASAAVALTQQQISEFEATQ